jgi:ABC-type protease/lipase transport system fused ATPase/permease subunit
VGRIVSRLLDLAWIILWITAAWMIHPALGCAVAGGFAALLATVINQGEHAENDMEG